MIVSYKELRAIFKIKDTKNRMLVRGLKNKIKFLHGNEHGEVEATDEELQRIITEFRKQGCLSLTEMAKRYNMTVNKVQSLARYKVIPSYKLRYGQGSKLLFLASEIDAIEDVELTYQKAQSNERLAVFFRKYYLSRLIEHAELSDRQRQVLGLMYSEHKTFEEIAELLDIRRELIRQTVIAAERKLIRHLWHLINYKRQDEHWKKLYEQAVTEKEMLETWVKQNMHKAPPTIPESLQEKFNMPITELDLTVRALNGLKSAGVDTVGQMITWKREGLMKIMNMGKKTVDEIEAEARELGLYLGMEIS